MPSNSEIVAAPPSEVEVAFLSTTPAGSVPDEYANNPEFLASQEELRALLFAIANSTAPTRAGSPTAAESIDVHEVYSTDPGCMKRILSHSPRMVLFLQNYIAKVAKWLDMFDSARAFGTQILALATSSPALLYAVLALSARQMERKQGASGSFESLELYQEAIKHLTPLLPSTDPRTIAVCVILCCLEMMSANPRDDWRRHLEGCASMFEAYEVHGHCGGLLQAVFWCYARMDLCGALISDGTEPTLLELARWLPQGTAESDAHLLFAQHRSPDSHANEMVYLCSAVCKLLAARTSFLELGAANGCTGAHWESLWQEHWDSVSRWLDNRPVEMLPLQSSLTMDGKVFPNIFFLHWAAISSNQLYHTACILLLQMRPNKRTLIPMTSVSSPFYHARQICGISMTNAHEGCLNNAIQPLWIAGRLLSHPEEQQELVSLIRRIENDTGWGMEWRIRDLEQSWGLR